MTQYSFRPAGPLSGPPFLSTAVGRLMIATVAVFFLQNLAPAVSHWLALVPRLVVENLQVWRIVTYMFLHGDFWHLFFNLIVLWFFGNMVESAWGARRFLRYYVVCGVGGALLQMLLQYDASVVGASGALFGLYLAAAIMFPDTYIYIYFVLPVKVKYFVAVLAVMQLAKGIAGPSGVAYFAHLGGMIAGVPFFRAEIMQRWRFATGPRRKWKAYVADRNRRDTARGTDNIDSILDKISAKGYENLTPTEKRILENYSRQPRDSSDESR